MERGKLLDQGSFEEMKAENEHFQQLLESS
jgi:ABC-type multidrug transport system fused ATPase/permease subunit